MGYDSEVFNSFWTKWNFYLVQKLSPRSYSIQFERKWKQSFLCVMNMPAYQLGFWPMFVIKALDIHNEGLIELLCFTWDDLYLMWDTAYYLEYGWILMLVCNVYMLFIHWCTCLPVAIYSGMYIANISLIIEHGIYCSLLKW